MQFLYSALSSNELKALYILLSPAHLYTPTPTGATGDQCTIAFSVYCQVLIYGWVNRSTFRVQILPRDSRYRRRGVRRDSNPRSRGWESSALTTRPTVLPSCTFVPSFLPSALSMSIPPSLPSFLPSALSMSIPSFLPSFLPSFRLPSCLPSVPPTFLLPTSFLLRSSYLFSFPSSFLPSFFLSFASFILIRRLYHYHTIYPAVSCRKKHEPEEFQSRQNNRLVSPPLNPDFKLESGGSFLKHAVNIKRLSWHGLKVLKNWPNRSSVILVLLIGTRIRPHRVLSLGLLISHWCDSASKTRHQSDLQLNASNKRRRDL